VAYWLFSVAIVDGFLAVAEATEHKKDWATDILALQGWVEASDWKD